MAGAERSANKPGFSLHLALAVTATAYLVECLWMVTHEAGHGWTALLLGGTFVDWYIAPTVVGFSWIDVNSPAYWPHAWNWVLAGGALTGVAISLFFLLAAWLSLKRRKRTWLGVFLAFAATDLSIMNVAYILYSIWGRWGDGYELVRGGVPPVVLYAAASVVILGPGLLGIALLWRALSPYLRLRKAREIWAMLIALYIPLYTYALLKAYLLLPEHYPRKRTQAIVVLVASLPVAALVALLGRFARLQDNVPPQRLRSCTVAGLVLLALAVEILFSLYFGFDL